VQHDVWVRPHVRAVLKVHVETGTWRHTNWWTSILYLLTKNWKEKLIRYSDWATRWMTEDWGSITAGTREYCCLQGSVSSPPLLFNGYWGLCCQE
jgi:hypothetical protein